MAKQRVVIEQELRRRIRVREWKPGMRIPSEAELCDEFGVSRTTVRAALANLRNERLLLSRPKIGTLVSSITGRAPVVVLARQNDLLTPYGFWYRDLADRVCEALYEAGFRPMLAAGFGGTAPELLETIEAHYGGVIRDAAGVVAVSPVTAEMEAFLNGPDMPPWTGVSYGIRPVAGTVFADYRAQLEMARDMFARNGIDDYAMAFVTHAGLPEEDQNEWYEPLVRDMLSREQRSRIDDYLIPVLQSPRFEQMREAFMNWWQRPRRPKAVFFCDDALFDAFSHLPVREHIQIPRDLSVITLANVGREFFSPITPARIGLDPDQVTAQLLELLELRRCNPARRDLACVANWVNMPGNTIIEQQEPQGAARFVNCQPASTEVAL